MVAHTSVRFKELAVKTSRTAFIDGKVRSIRQKKLAAVFIEGGGRVPSATLFFELT